MAKVTIDGEEIEVPDGITVLQACEMAGKEIPRFCYHERLSVAGNCRMCLVEVAPGPPKPAASCALPVGEGMAIKTNTPMVKKAREGVMEFLLINHPLDCPICDQGGECDLQDQSMAYGAGQSRFRENKRAVVDKNIGPLVKTQMTRCIQCTRCVRFITEVAGVEELGATGRGESMEITTYVEKALSSELSANIIDLCPVGALTSKPYAFNARPWELTRTESIDVLDAVGSNIRIDSRGREVLRVLPVTNDEINEEWISDKTRFACDGLKRQRLDRPYVKRDGKLKQASWGEALEVIAQKVRELDSKKIAAIVGDQPDCESIFVLKELMTSLNVGNIDCRQKGERLDVRTRASYIFNTSISGIDEADACLLIGCNPRLEAPVLNARLRKRWVGSGLKFGLVGIGADLTYPLEHLGLNPSVLREILEGRHPFRKVLDDAEKPMLILGSAAISRPDGSAIMKLAKEIADRTGMVCEGWNGFNFLHTAASRVGALDIGFVPRDPNKSINDILQDAELVYLLGADEIDPSLLKDPFVVYQGHHGDLGAHSADVILPGAAYTEKSATYVNTEGRVQRGTRAVFPPGEAKEDWTIVKALSDTLGCPLPFRNIGMVREGLAKLNPIFSKRDILIPASWQEFGEEGPVLETDFGSAVENFYMTDPISRASETMANCAREIRGFLSKTVAHG
jgi:NADH-quinone oxidoreductase subunit G